MVLGQLQGPQLQDKADWKGKQPLPELRTQREGAGEDLQDSRLTYRVQDWWLYSLDQKQAGRRGRSSTDRCEGEPG